MWYTSAVEKKVTTDARKLGGFDRDILGWNIPEEELAVLLRNSVTTSG